MAVREATVGPLSGTIEVSTWRHLDLVVADAQLLRDELGEDGLRALAHLGVGR